MDIKMISVFNHYNKCIVVHILIFSTIPLLVETLPPNGIRNYIVCAMRYILEKLFKLKSIGCNVLYTLECPYLHYQVALNFILFALLASYTACVITYTYFVKKWHSRLQKNCFNFTLDGFDILSIVSVFKPSIEDNKFSMCVKWEKVIISSNNMTSFTIAENISKFLSGGAPPRKLTTWILVYFLMGSLQDSYKLIYQGEFVMLLFL